MSAARYVVHYGSNLSKETFSSWNKAAWFIKHCIDTGTRIREVQKLGSDADLVRARASLQEVKP